MGIRDDIEALRSVTRRRMDIIGDELEQKLSKKDYAEYVECLHDPSIHSTQIKKWLETQGYVLEGTTVGSYRLEKLGVRPDGMKRSG